MLATATRIVAQSARGGPCVKRCCHRTLASGHAVRSLFLHAVRCVPPTPPASGPMTMSGAPLRWYAASAKNVKVVREQTGLAIKVCRQALEESGDNVEEALAWIEANASARGDKAAAKLGDRATAEGRIAVTIDGVTSGLAEIACETDFVARTDTVDNLVHALARAAAASSSTDPGVTLVDVDALLADGLADDVKAAIAAVGENIVVRRAGAFSVAPGGVLGSYVHGVGSFAAVVGLTGAGTDGAAVEFADKLAQQIVAVDPGDGGVPALLEAPFLFDGEKTVGEVLDRTAPGATVAGYVRWATPKFGGD
eukprot:m.197584 g.197584  ORF g.197584 m.197584 type:complete len:310 (-) comp20169_c0_seq1:212-1141(-)